MAPPYVLLSEVRVRLAVGDAVRLREAARLSQADVARAIKVTPATISRWEAGLREPSGPGALRYGRLLRRLAERAEAVAA